MKITGYRVLLDPGEIDEKFESTLDLVKPEDTKDHEKRNIQSGEVLQVGPDAYNNSECVAPWCKPGDKVLFIRGSATLFDYNGKDLLIINDSDILATL